jgi:two-component system nitrogen regulation sensor histidine kinase NtrY
MASRSAGRMPADQPAGGRRYLSLRAKIVIYLVALHVILGVAAVVVLMRQPMLLFGVELVFVISIVVSYRLVRALFVPLDLISTGAELISERDFSSRFVPVGQPEMDTLINVYNEMIDRLHEERLTTEEQQQLLQKIVDASPSGVVICDFDGRVQQMNPTARRLVTDDLLRDMQAIGNGESRLMPLEGTRRIRIQRAEFRDRGFAKSFFIVEELTEELRVSEKTAYEKLIRLVSHEVNNSVGAVRSLLESMRHYGRDVRDDDREDYDNAITIASSRMDALNRFVGDFADVVRIPSPHRRPFAAASVIQQISTLLAPELREKNIRLVHDLDGSVTIDADRSQFEQVVLNVIRNAEEAVGSNGEIGIVLRSGCLSVTDTGHGIPDSVRGELFTPFFSTKRNGRGLGLVLIQEILANHGFGYSLENRPGGGAEFRITWS